MVGALCGGYCVVVDHVVGALCGGYPVVDNVPNPAWIETTRKEKEREPGYEVGK